MAFKCRCSTAISCLICAGGKVCRPPLAPETVTAMVARWEAADDYDFMG